MDWASFRNVSFRMSIVKVGSQREGIDFTSLQYVYIYTAKVEVVLTATKVCCAYQALRMTNFMAHPSLEAIQTLLIIGNVLSYNMNPGCSYILLGMDNLPSFVDDNLTNTSRHDDQDGHRNGATGRVSSFLRSRSLAAWTSLVGSRMARFSFQHVV